MMRFWLGPISALLLICPWILGNSECNAFGAASDKATTEALIFSAHQQLNNADYDGALATIAQLSTAARGSHDGRVLEASAYAGKCGLNFMNFAYDLAQNVPPRRLLEFLLAEMKAATTYSHCSTAEGLMLGISSADMTADDWVFLAFLEFVKIGAALETEGVDSPAHSGVVNSGLDSCAISDTVAREIGTGISIAANSLNNSGLTVGGSIGSLCNGPAQGGVGFPCSIVSPSGFSAAEVKVIRALVKSNEIGFNLCNGSLGSSASCSCP